MVGLSEVTQDERCLPIGSYRQNHTLNLVPCIVKNLGLGRNVDTQVRFKVCLYFLVYFLVYSRYMRLQ